VATVDLVAEAVQNPLFFIPRFMKIEDKERNEVPFVLNAVQEDIVKHLMAGERRLNVLKAGQLGVTSIVMAYFLWDTILTPGTASVVIAHEEFITQRLLHKSQLFYDSIPPQFKPEMHHSSAYEKTFPAINGTMYTGSARAYIFGRGETLHNVLADEYAFWPDPERIMVPLQQRVPITGLIMKVSTPNGEDNAFCLDWRASKRGELIGTAIYKNLVYPWWLCPEYRIPRGSVFALERDKGELDFTLEEEKLIAIHHLDEDQIRWRRRKIEEMEQLRATGETAKYFWQEYVEDEETCFLATGDMVYDAETLKMHAANAYKAPHTIENFKVWYPPEEGVQYAVVIDPSQAKITKTAITVWKFEQPETGPEKPIHCATFAGLVGPEQTAIKAERIARLYNTALIVIEANSHGLAVVVCLKNYPKLYYRRDIASGREGMQIGWLTTPKTKPYMIQQLQQTLPFMVTHDLDLIGEMRGMRFQGDKVISLGDDDIHDTAAIAMATHRPHRGKRGYAGQAGWNQGW
jgi:hypothetical protein